MINYQRESISEVVKREAPKGVNVFWETRREPDFDLAVDLMAPRGRMVLMAGRDARPVFPVGPFYVKECSLHGFVMFKATPVEMRAAADEINHWLAQGKLRANIAAPFPLDQAADAHRLQEAATLEGTARSAWQDRCHHRVNHLEREARSHRLLAEEEKISTPLPKRSR